MGYMDSRLEDKRVRDAYVAALKRYDSWLAATPVENIQMRAELQAAEDAYVARFGRVDDAEARAMQSTARPQGVK
jgi:hypothetical protein